MPGQLPKIKSGNRFPGKYTDFAKEQSINFNLISSVGLSPSKTPIKYTPPEVDPDYVTKGYVIYDYVALDAPDLAYVEVEYVLDEYSTYEP